MAVVFNEKEIIEVNTKTVDELKESCPRTVRNRFRLCLHHDVNDIVHEMVIVFSLDTFIPPHRHGGKSESYHMIEGEMDVFFFDNEGAVSERIGMGSYESDKTFLYRLSGNIWHMPVPRSKTVVFKETFCGPFRKSQDVEYAPWAPGENDDEAILAFLKKIAHHKR